MKFEDAKVGVKVFNEEFPEEVGEIMEIGNDYIHILMPGNSPSNPLTIHPSDLKDFKLAEPAPIKWVEPKTWDEFRKTGLFMFVNTILHAFGWALVVDVEYDKEKQIETGPVTNCYPARVKFRGFSEDDQSEMHERIGIYLADNADDLKEDTKL